MKRFLIVLTAVGVMAGTTMLAMAQGPAAGAKKEGKEPKAEKPKQELTEITLTGKITTEQIPSEKGPAVTAYFINDAAAGKVKLPASKAPKAKQGEAAAAPAVNPAEFVDKDVKLTGKGFRSEHKSGKKTVKIEEIVKIELAVKEG